MGGFDVDLVARDARATMTTTRSATIRQALNSNREDAPLESQDRDVCMLRMPLRAPRRSVSDCMPSQSLRSQTTMMVLALAQRSWAGSSATDGATIPSKQPF